jgi:hypothetical protein
MPARAPTIAMSRTRLLDTSLTVLNAARLVSACVEKAHEWERVVKPKALTASTVPCDRTCGGESVELIVRQYLTRASPRHAASCPVRFHSSARPPLPVFTIRAGRTQRAVASTSSTLNIFSLFNPSSTQELLQTFFRTTTYSDLLLHEHLKPSRHPARQNHLTRIES